MNDLGFLIGLTMAVIGSFGAGFGFGVLAGGARCARCRGGEPE